ncbi:MAG: hypothetical protein KC910_34785 [Candidatus Eremiobacteraeota bacterium]|nr:hypothetical protein [Candidatus Eremiobacteraeota bacterium]
MSRIGAFSNSDLQRALRGFDGLRTDAEAQVELRREARARGLDPHQSDSQLRRALAADDNLRAGVERELRERATLEVVLRERGLLL